MEPTHLFMIVTEIFLVLFSLGMLIFYLSRLRQSDSPMRPWYRRRRSVLAIALWFMPLALLPNTFPPGFFGSYFSFVFISSLVSIVLFVLTFCYALLLPI